MKTKDIAKQYGIDQARFEGYLRKAAAGKDGIMGFNLDDNIQEHVEKFKAIIAEEQEKQETEQRERQRAEGEAESRG